MHTHPPVLYEECAHFTQPVKARTLAVYYFGILLHQVIIRKYQHFLNFFKKKGLPREAFLNTGEII